MKTSHTLVFDDDLDTTTVYIPAVGVWSVHLSTATDELQMLFNIVLSRMEVRINLSRYMEVIPCYEQPKPKNGSNFAQEGMPQNVYIE